MKKLVYLALILCLFSSCGQKQEEVEKHMEDGVEVIVNHLEPYSLSGEPNTLILEERFSIDTASMNIARIGLWDIVAFRVDSESNIYCTSSKNIDYYVFKFDKNGRFVKSFGRRGQGPGEVHRGGSLNINSKDEIEIYQVMPNVISFFNKDGIFIREMSLDSGFTRAMTLENGNYLVFGPAQVVDPSSESGVHTPLRLLDSEFKEIVELDRRLTPDPANAKKMKFTEHIFQWRISDGKIFAGNEERGYEILVYDLKGKLIRKIKKEYKPVKLPEEIKQKFVKSMKFFADRVYFPDHLGPFQSIFTDEKGRLLVATYEKGTSPGEYIHDIFNPDGIFICRKSFNHSAESKYGSNISLPALARNNRLYCLQESESGFRRLQVYNMRWE